MIAGLVGTGLDWGLSLGQRFGLARTGDRVPGRRPGLGTGFLAAGWDWIGLGTESLVAS